MFHLKDENLFQSYLDNPETNFGHMQVSNSEIGNFGQAQVNQGIARKHTYSRKNSIFCFPYDNSGLIISTSPSGCASAETKQTKSKPLTFWTTPSMKPRLYKNYTK